MLTIWGRANSVNVQKVLWLCDELRLDHHRIDAGGRFGRTSDPDYLTMNPNGLVPTLVDGDFVLWESHSILRYLALEYGAGRALYPDTPKGRVSVDRWLDWTLSRLQPAQRPVFWSLIRTPPAERDMASLNAAAEDLAHLWQVLDQHLGGRTYTEGDNFTIADVALGANARRWFAFEGIRKPDMPHLEDWYRGIQDRDGFKRYVGAPLT